MTGCIMILCVGVVMNMLVQELLRRRDADKLAAWYESGQ